MKKVTLTIGVPVKKVALKDCFKFETKFMHGDADAYSTQKLIVSGHDLANRVAMVIDEFADHEVYDRHDARNLLETLCIGQDDVFALLEDYLMEGDITCDRQVLALIQQVNITYFSTYGVEHFVSKEKEHV